MEGTKELYSSEVGVSTLGTNRVRNQGFIISYKEMLVVNVGLYRGSDGIQSWLMIDP
jgi:hypothetical protein